MMQGEIPGGAPSSAYRRPRASRSALRCVLLALAGLVVLAAPAAAGLRTGLSGEEFISADAAVRSHWFDEADRARARVIRLEVKWRNIELRVARNPTDPADPAYDWGALDGAVRDARARGLDPLLTVYRAPEWHLGPNPPAGRSPGTWKPDPVAYGNFAKALATRYSGQYGGLPAVHKFEAWNEPNIPLFLSPQYEGGKPFAAGWYRQLLNSFRAGVTAVGKKNKVLSAGMAPYGDPPGGLRTRPLVFLRQLFCLKKSLKARKCPDKASFDIAGAHPITIGGGPTQHAINRDDAATADFPKIRATLRAAERHHTVKPRGKGRPLWATEMWWETNPPDPGPGAVSPAKQAKFIEQAILQLFDQGAKVVINFPIVDRPGALACRVSDPSLGGCRFDTQAGLFFQDGRAKPSLTAFSFPLVTHRKNKRQVNVQGKAPRAGKLVVQRAKGRRWVAVKRRKVNAGQTFSFVVRQHGKAKFRAKVGGARSLVWHQGG